MRQDLFKPTFLCGCVFAEMLGACGCGWIGYFYVPVAHCSSSRAEAPHEIHASFHSTSSTHLLSNGAPPRLFLFHRTAPSRSRASPTSVAQRTRDRPTPAVRDAVKACAAASSIEHSSATRAIIMSAFPRDLLGISLWKKWVLNLGGERAYSYWN